jgi:hypothetical protein
MVKLVIAYAPIIAIVPYQPNSSKNLFFICKLYNFGTDDKKQRSLFFDLAGRMGGY